MASTARQSGARGGAVALGAVLMLACAASRADPPKSSYIFPAGAQRGSEVTCRVGTLFCAHDCGFRILDENDQAGNIAAPDRIERIDTLVLKGPYHHNPTAQLAWDYPKDMSATLNIAANAHPGIRYWFCTTAEGATELRPFVIGDLPEVLEDEQATTVGNPQDVILPVTINGRMFPRADLDEYRFTAAAGEVVSCEVVSHRLGYQLDARLELRDASGRLVAQADDHFGPDSLVIATIPADGEYVLRIHDIAYEGAQDDVYRLSLRTGPCVTHAFPAGANKTDGANVRLYGEGLGDEGFLDWTTTWNDVSGWSVPEGVNMFCPLQVSDVAEVVEREPNDETTQRITLPTVINGRAQAIGDVDTFAFTASEGEAFVFDAFGRRLVSPMTTVVAVHDSAGKELARHEGDGPQHFTAPSAGEYTLHISELFRETHAGDEYIYRVVARRTPPDFELRLAADNVGLEPGATAKLKLRVTRIAGFGGEVRLSADSLPNGVTLDTAVIPADAGEIEISLTATADAPIGITPRAKILGTATIDGAEVVHAATIDRSNELTSPPLTTSSQTAAPIETVAVTVTYAQVFEITTTDVYGSANRGATLVQTHHLERLGDFDGAVEISLSDAQDRYLQGATGPTMILQPGETAFDYPAFMPESMDLNRTARIVVMGTARVTDQTGRQHWVTHRTKNQMVVRVCPSLLTLGAKEEYFEATPGSTLSIPLHLGRTAEITGDVTLETVADNDTPIAASPALAVAPHTAQVDYPLQLAPDATPGELCKVKLRATGLRDGYPAVAETKVEIQVVDGR